MRVEVMDGENPWGRWMRESDKRRLDWLGENPEGVDYFEGAWYTVNGIEPFETLREAIDEAMR